jgi:hypothetical protein
MGFFPAPTAPNDNPIVHSASVIEGEPVEGRFSGHPQLLPLANAITPRGCAGHASARPVAEQTDGVGSACWGFKLGGVG